MKATAFINAYNKSKKKIDQKCMEKIRDLLEGYLYSQEYHCALTVLKECPDAINTWCFVEVYGIINKLSNIGFTKWKSFQVKYSVEDAMEIIYKACCPAYFSLFLYKLCQKQNSTLWNIPSSTDCKDMCIDRLHRFKNCSFYSEINKIKQPGFMRPHLCEIFDKHVQLLLVQENYYYKPTIVDLTGWEKMVDHDDPVIVELYRNAIWDCGDPLLERIILYILTHISYYKDYRKGYEELLIKIGIKLEFQKCFDILLKYKKYECAQYVYQRFNKPMNFDDLKELPDETVYKIVFNKFTHSDLDTQKLDYYNKERGLAFVVYYSFVESDGAPFFATRAIQYYVSEIDWGYKISIPNYPEIKTLSKLLFWIIDIQYERHMIYVNKDRERNEKLKALKLPRFTTSYPWVVPYLQIFEEFYYNEFADIKNNKIPRDVVKYVISKNFQKMKTIREYED